MWQPLANEGLAHDLRRDRLSLQLSVPDVDVHEGSWTGTKVCRPQRAEVGKAPRTLRGRGRSRNMLARSYTSHAAIWPAMPENSGQSRPTRKRPARDCVTAGRDSSRLPAQLRQDLGAAGQRGARIGWLVL